MNQHQPTCPMDDVTLDSESDDEDGDDVMDNDAVLNRDILEAPVHSTQLLLASFHYPVVPDIFHSDGNGHRDVNDDHSNDDADDDDDGDGDGGENTHNRALFEVVKRDFQRAWQTKSSQGYDQSKACNWAEKYRIMNKADIDHLRTIAAPEFQIRKRHSGIIAGVVEANEDNVTETTQYQNGSVNVRKVNRSRHDGICSVETDNKNDSMDGANDNCLTQADNENGSGHADNDIGRKPELRMPSMEFLCLEPLLVERDRYRRYSRAKPSRCRIEHLGALKSSKKPCSVSVQYMCRKEKSLGQLCIRFVEIMSAEKELVRRGPVKFKLDETSKLLDTSRRRVYDVVNILESIEVVTRAGKNTYLWLGMSKLNETLQKLKALSYFSGFEKYASAAVATGKAIVHASYSDRIPAKFSCDGRLRKSICAISQKFLMLFLSCKPGDQVCMKYVSSFVLCGVGGKRSSTADGDSRAFDGNMIHDNSLNVLGESCANTLKRPADAVNEISQRRLTAVSNQEEGHGQDIVATPYTRRMYDIANVFTALGLINRVPSPRFSCPKPVYVYVGPTVKTISVEEFFYLLVNCSVKSKQSILSEFWFEDERFLNIQFNPSTGRFEYGKILAADRQGKISIHIQEKKCPRAYRRIMKEKDRKPTRPVSKLQTTALNSSEKVPSRTGVALWTPALDDETTPYVPEGGAPVNLGQTCRRSKRIKLEKMSRSLMRKSQQCKSKSHFLGIIEECPRRVKKEARKTPVHNTCHASDALQNDGATSDVTEVTVKHEPVQK